MIAAPDRHVALDRRLGDLMQEYIDATAGAGGPDEVLLSVSECATAAMHATARMLALLPPLHRAETAAAVTRNLLAHADDHAAICAGEASAALAGPTLQ